jgi:hypothetical protein
MAAAESASPLRPGAAERPGGWAKVRKIDRSSVELPGNERQFGFILLNN